jgi:hypothetical protein
MPPPRQHVVAAAPAVDGVVAAAGADDVVAAAAADDVRAGSADDGVGAGRADDRGRMPVTLDTGPKSSGLSATRRRAWWSVRSQILVIEDEPLIPAFPGRAQWTPAW